MRLGIKFDAALVFILFASLLVVQFIHPFEDNYWSIIFDFIGSFHPLILHLPIGLWFAVCALMVASVFARDSVPRSVIFGLTVLTFVCALLTFSAGFILYLVGLRAGDDRISYV